MKGIVTKAHVRVFRAVEGAVLNAAHGHPGWKLSSTMARSIAKRAAGTLTAEWPEVLADRQLPSEKAHDPGAGGHWPPRRRVTNPSRAGARSATGRAPLKFLWVKLARLIGEAKRAGDHSRADILIEIIIELDKIRKQQ